MPLQNGSVTDTHLFNLKQIRKYTFVKLWGGEEHNLCWRKGECFIQVECDQFASIKKHSVFQEEDTNVLWVRGFVEKIFGNEQRCVYVKSVEMKLIVSVK